MCSDGAYIDQIFIPDDDPFSKTTHVGLLNAQAVVTVINFNFINLSNYIWVINVINLKKIMMRK